MKNYALSRYVAIEIIYVSGVEVVDATQRGWSVPGAVVQWKLGPFPEE
jgi:hypothetical protein